MKNGAFHWKQSSLKSPDGNTNSTHTSRHNLRVVQSAFLSADIKIPTHSLKYRDSKLINAVKQSDTIVTNITRKNKKPRRKINHSFSREEFELCAENEAQG